MKFVDTVNVSVSAGNGGNGVVSTLRLKYKPLAGSDGGNGGNGGSIFFVASKYVSSLLNFHFKPHIKADSGEDGKGKYKNGTKGKDIYLEVPLGTVIFEVFENGVQKQLDDLLVHNSKCLVAKGGSGGLGNAALSTHSRKHPNFALLGEPGENKTLKLELKLIADVALVGFPSSGKSSLINSLSAVKAKVADYPFTTLKPNIGIGIAEDKRYVIADVPGLIKGASEGKGLGLEFLRHIERTRIIVHVVDMGNLDPNRNPVNDIKVIENELNNYPQKLNQPRVIVLNKMDLPDSNDMYDIIKNDLNVFGYKIFSISALNRSGIDKLNYFLCDLVNEQNKKDESIFEPEVVLTPKPVDKPAMEVLKHKNYFEVIGEKPLRWALQTDINNAEALEYFENRLQKLKLNELMEIAGANEGDMIKIGALEFEWRK